MNNLKIKLRKQCHQNISSELISINLVKEGKYYEMKITKYYLSIWIFELFEYYWIFELFEISERIPRYMKSFDISV